MAEPGTTSAADAAITPTATVETNYAPAIYGSILVAALISSLDEEHASAGAMAVAVLTTMLVFWLAHVWADVMSARVNDPRHFTGADIVRLARRQWPMIESALVPLAALVLAWLRAWSLTLAVDLALGLAVAQLVAWGIYVGRRTFSAWPLALLFGAVDGALGLAIVALKVLVH